MPMYVRRMCSFIAEDVGSLNCTKTKYGRHAGSHYRRHAQGQPVTLHQPLLQVWRVDAMLCCPSNALVLFTVSDK